MEKDNTLTIIPPVTLPWLSEEERNSSVILLDVEADFVKNDTFRIDLDVIFNPITVTRSGVTQADFYVGSTGAEILIQFEGNSIKDYTKDMTISGEYAISNKRHRVASLKISPSLKPAQAPAHGSVNLGEISLKKDSEKTFEVRFANSERVLASLYMKGAVKWTLNLPRAEHVIRDFLFVNLYLFAECEFTSKRVGGSVSVRPSNVLFFDGERRLLSKRKSILMLYELWKRGVDVRNKDGLAVKFSADRADDEFET